MELPTDAWEQITWREGGNAELSSRFARLRVRPAQDEARRSQPAPEEWPDDDREPNHYRFSMLPSDMPFKDMVDRT